MYLKHAAVYRSKMNHFSTLSKISSLKKMNLRISFGKIPAFDLDEKFQVIDFYNVTTFQMEPKILSLPHGPGVVYLRIQRKPRRKEPFTSQIFRILNEKFPKLKLLVLPYGSSVEVQPGEFDFEVQTTSAEFDDLLNQFPSLTLTY